LLICGCLHEHPDLRVWFGLCIRFASDFKLLSLHLQVVLEYEGVVMEDNAELHSQAWAKVAEEEGKERPLHFLLQRAQGMKDEQVTEPSNAGMCI
jgi:hypothetical protein